MNREPSCIFCKIVSGEIPKKFEFENTDIVAFPDIRPIKPVHLLIVPKIHITDFTKLENDLLLGKIRVAILGLIEQNKLTNTGYRVVINGGGAQVVDHLHFHLMGPMGKAAEL
jgi:histidine triad (HIT) family protein